MNRFIYRLDTGEIDFRYAEGIIDKPEKEFHSENEIYFIWDGDVELISEFGRKQILHETAVIIPKENFHQFQFVGKQNTNYIRCNLKFDDVQGLNELVREKIQCVFTVRDKRITEVFCRLQELKLQNISDTEKKILTKAYLAELLVALPSGISDNSKDFSFISPVTRLVISYIHENISENIGIDEIAEALNQSSSHISHLFKQDMKISVHKYILNKRLVQANIKIRNGVKPMVAAEKCGFWDYSNFYNQYKKRFGHPPSKENTTHTHPSDIDSK